MLHFSAVKRDEDQKVGYSTLGGVYLHGTLESFFEYDLVNIHTLDVLEFLNGEEDGFEREKWIRRHPKSDAKWRYHHMVERALAKGGAPTHPLMMRRYFFKRWFTTMQSEFWQHFLPEFKLSILKELMRMVNQYVNTGKVGEKMAEKGTKLDTVFSVFLHSAQNVAIKKVEKNVDSIPLE